MRYLRWLTIYVGRCFFYFRPTLKKEERQEIKLGNRSKLRKKLLKEANLVRGQNKAKNCLVNVALRVVCAV